MLQPNSSGNSPELSTESKVTAVTSHVAPWFSLLVYPIGRYIILPFYFGRIEVTGQEYLPKEGPVILAPTHRSRWDSFMVPYAAGRDITGRDLRFMVTSDEMEGLQGWVIRRFGGFPIDTKNPGISSIRHGIELLQDGETLVIFPEGNIYREEQVQPIKPGLARIALQAESSQPGLGVKILPITIRYSEPIPHRGCNVTIRIGSPIQVADYLTKSVKRSAGVLTTDLENALKAIAESQDQPKPKVLAGSA